ncbi:MAG: tetratricopeptide repeat protein [Chthoniobacteraceae bacterium]
MNRLTMMLATASLAGCTQLVHVPPGTSVELALARKPEVLRTPEAAKPSTPHSPRIAATRDLGDLDLPPVEPELPTSDSVTAVAEAYARGNEALQSGKNDEAISALQRAVTLDPKFGEAWHLLAMAFENAGKPDKAREAYRHSKGAGQ